MQNHKILIKTANCVLAAVAQLKAARLVDMQSRLQEIGNKSLLVVQNSRRSIIATQKGWYYAARNTLDQVNRDLSDFNYYITRFRECVSIGEIMVPTLTETVAELQQLQQEFDLVSFDPAEKMISVSTKPIVFDDIALGRFEIRLMLGDFQQFYTVRPFRIIALDPNPAGTDECITHPHVSHQILCEGDGHTAISKALEQGRICDFFSLAAGILDTYNPDSPYVPLADWEGRSCYDCGSRIRLDDSYYCEFCDSDFCDHCSSYCQECETTFCLGCAYECPGCGRPVCRRCIGECIDCGKRFCKECLTDQLCEPCQDLRKEQEDEDEQESESVSAV
jgi:hypothetical protein